jgi:alcohol dehydrogenase (cytochrome c)
MSSYLFIVLSVSGCFAQHGSTTASNPFNSAEDRAEGERLYRGQCAACHGPRGSGGSGGPDLTSGVFRKATSDAAMFDVIARGSTGMPGYGGSAKQVWQLVAFVNSLSVGGGGRAKGDARRGAALFAAKGCASCHRGLGEGPRLNGAGKTRPLGYLRRAILEPQADVASEHWRVKGRAKDGTEFSGVRLNEDSYSIQFRSRGELRTYLKEELAEFELLRESPMPSYAGKLSDAEMDDLLAYLLSLEEAAAEPTPGGKVMAARLREASREPRNWLTYNGSYLSQHHSELNAITPENVSRLGLEWTYQARSLEKFETTPLVVDGVMYLTEAPNTIAALDARTGRLYWKYVHALPPVTYACCGNVNRGLAIVENRLLMGTLDAKLIAVDAITGSKLWETVVASYEKGYALTHAPLVVNDKAIVGVAGGELGIQGFIAAYDVRTGQERWRFHTVPRPGEPGNETWGKDSWKYGGGSIWVTGSYDAELNLTYWGVGNPGPDWNPAARPGDNLYTSSVVALDAGTGKKKWHFQFTPHDEWDWDSAQVPVLADLDWQGRPRKLMLWGNRNAFFYVLDRTNGEFLLGRPFARQNWAKGLDATGRPVKEPGRGPSAAGTVTYPGVQGATNWYAPSFSPRTGLFYLTAWDDYHSTYYSWDQPYEQGKWYAGGAVKAPVPATRREEIFRRSSRDGYGAVRALNPLTGETVWDYRMTDVSDGGILTTATNVLFSGNREGYIFALDARDGKLLWKRYLGGQVLASPITYEAGGRQFVSLAAGTTLYTFALPLN